MKYIKKYELFSVGHDVEYSVGDIVVCTETKLDRLLMKNDAEWLKNPLLEEGKKYKILKLYKTLEDKFLNKKFLRVDVEDI